MKLRSGKSYNYKTYKRKSKAKKANQEVATVGTVKRIVNSGKEHKYIQFYVSGLTLANVASFIKYDIFLPGQGWGDSERIGDKIKLDKYIDFRYTIRADQTSTILQHARVILLQWHDMVASFNASNVLRDNTVGDRSILSPYSVDEKNRFTVLYDRVHSIGIGDPTRDSGGVPTMVNVWKNVRVKRPNIQFLNGGTTYLDNHVYLCVFSNVSTTAPIMSAQVQIKYTDS